MGDQSAIHWTDATWNPLVGCSRVSEGCRKCYAEREAYRQEHNLGQPKYAGTTKWVSKPDGPRGEPRWTGLVALWEPVLDQPLQWRKPRRIFVNSMSDLFHEQVPDEWIDRIFGVMAQASQHTFQVLTKRPERMRDYVGIMADRYTRQARGVRVARAGSPVSIPDDAPGGMDWPLPNVWLGVSVEDQATADTRIPLLLQTPAAVRFLSVEPLLGPVDLAPKDSVVKMLSPFYGPNGFDETGSQPVRERRSWHFPNVNWVIVGGESGPGARPCHLRWIRGVRDQCRGAGVPIFVKQAGSRPIVEDSDFGQLGEYVRCSEDGSNEVRFRDRKGGEPAEWPEDLRVREYPR